MNTHSNDNTMKTPNSILHDTAIVAVAAALLLLIPLLARFDWTMIDFIAAWILLFGAGLTFRLITRKVVNKVYKAATLVAVGTALFMVWANLAVGLIGSENNSANLMYVGVLAVLLIGAIIARFHADGMSLTLFSTALAQVLVTLIALIGELGPMIQILGVNGFFITFWIISALLFRYAALELNTGKTEKPE